MKKCLIVSWIFAVMLCCNVFGQTADQLDVIQGTNDLANDDLVDANSNFVAALAFQPTNEDANVLVAFTRLLLVPQTPAGSNFLNGLNFPAAGRDIYNWTSSPPHDIYGGPTFPAGYNSTNFVFFYHTNVMPLVAASLANLANLADTNFLLTLDLGQPGGLVTIDYGDVQLFRAMLNAANLLSYTLDANNASFILPQIVSWGDTNGLTIQRALATYPSLLILHNTNDLIPSELALSNAAALYFTASDFIRNYRLADDTNDSITIAPDDVNQEADFRMELSNVLASVNEPTQFDPSDPFSIVYLGPYFSGTNSVRKLVPQFFNDSYVDNTLPDYTFAGMLPDEPKYETENALRKLFFSRAGIYTGNSADGTNGVSDFTGMGSGAFAAFISTNGQSVLFGYDSVDDSGSGTVPFFVSFTVDSHGKWQTTNSAFDASGSMDSSGDFNGTIDILSNGVPIFTITLQGNEQNPSGPFQNSDGLYSGKFTGGDGGTLYGILAADGELYYEPLTNPNNEIQTGGNGQFSSPTQIQINAIDGTVVNGTLNPNTFVITGDYDNTTNNSSGTFSISRTEKVNSDVAPTITSDLPASVTIPEGNTLKLTLGAVGSAPLSYQWYFNGNPIPGADSSTLVVSNNLWQTTGQYQIWATVNNVAGETNSQTANINVTLETNVPTITITSPKPGQLWSNSTFTVTGTASDKLGITGVYYYVNNGMFAEATNNSGNWATWSAPNVPLTPGTNTIYAYAYNLGGIAATNSVKIVYVLSGALTIITNGMGSITPYSSGTLLQIGKSYSLTATATDGFKLASWTGGTNLPLQFYTNGPIVQFTMSNSLTMQANFVDAEKPFISITNVTSGMQVSNAAFTVLGRATDNVAVASVSYSLNSPVFSTTVVATNSSVGWANAIALTPGTNTFSVYATDTSGNNSVTDTVKIVYILSATLTVETNGLGIITPVDNGDLLQIGKIYTLTAAGKGGFMFTNWTGSTNGTFTVLTNKPALSFMMESNLVLIANLVDTNQPLLKITNAPAGSGLVLTNATGTLNFTVKGTVTDVEAVSNVQYTLNGSSLTSATTSDNWTNWSSQLLSLEGGTNIFTAFATGTNGINSATNTVRIFVVSSNLLQLTVSGKGAISPSNTLLRVGENYTVTATPLHGWVFTNWTGAISGSPLIPVSEKPALTFLMESNLMLQANFVDTNQPFVKITNAPGLLFSNNFTLMGTVTDDVAIASVNCTLNGSTVQNVTTNAIVNGVSWSAPLSLEAGTNFFSVSAVATNGNTSALSNLRLIFVSTNLLTLQANGDGIISPTNTLLHVGQNYTITATPKLGWVFTNWSGSTNGEDALVVLTNKPAVTFMMFSNLIMQANFTDTNKPFLKITNAPTGPVATNQFTLMGLATNDVEIASVNYSINNSAFTPATTSPAVNGVSWSADLTILPGTNKFAAYATATNGNVSATNSLIIIRAPSVTTFLIATNEDITEPSGRIAFDNTNYLVVFQGSNSAMGQFVSTNGTREGSPLSLNPGGSDDPPALDFDGTNYLVAWSDFSSGVGEQVKGVFVSPVTQQPVGSIIPLSSSTTVRDFSTVVYGGGSYFIMWSDSGTSPDSIYGAMVSPSGGTNGDFLISNNGTEVEADQNEAAFDGTNFLAVWSGASGKFGIYGQRIDTQGNLVGEPIQIYTNSTSAGTGVPSVLFNGTDYLVLFNTGINTGVAGSYHVLGRFVTPSGVVLTNQVNLTADAGPQIVGTADLDGFNYLMAWNQGLNPFVLNKSATINARFFDLTGEPVSAEFPVFKTQGPLVPLFAPVLFDGTKFVLVGGLGNETTADFTFTNGVIYGAFVQP